MGLHWGDEEPLPDWVYVVLLIICILGLVYGAAK